MKVSRCKKVNTDTNIVEEPFVNQNTYADGIKYIKMAIDSLATVAKDDQLAKDSIANLSVVLFDLQ